MQDPHLSEEGRFSGLAGSEEKDFVLELRPPILDLNPPRDPGVVFSGLGFLAKTRTEDHGHGQEVDIWTRKRLKCKMRLF